MNGQVGLTTVTAPIQIEKIEIGRVLLKPSVAVIFIFTTLFFLISFFIIRYHLRRFSLDGMKGLYVLTWYTIGGLFFLFLTLVGLLGIYH